MEVGEKDPVDGKRVEADPHHAPHRPRTEVEDERLPARLYHDAALPTPYMGHHRPRPYHGDLQVPLPFLILPVLGRSAFLPSAPNAPARPAAPSRAPPRTSEGQWVPR